MCNGFVDGAQDRLREDVPEMRVESESTRSIGVLAEQKQHRIFDLRHGAPFGFRKLVRDKPR